MTAARCRCGCVADNHLHYRAGTDCGHCGIERCDAFLPADFTDNQAEAYLALAPFALPTDHIAENPMTAPDQPTFSTDDGDTYVRVNPAGLENYDDVDALSVVDSGAATSDGTDTGGEH